jgi:SRSO17 transposase
MGGMQWNAKQGRQSIQRFKAFMVPLVAALGRSERRAAATSYVQGLLMPGQRKSIEPMAARLGVPSQRLQQFVADSPWDENALWGVIRRRVLPHLEPVEAWIVDETGWLKQGQHSVGVARQYCGAVGKRANCQVSVELVVSDGEVAAPVGGRLYLPQSWLDDPARCAKAGVPAEVGFATKPQIALSLIEQARADQVAPAPVLADAAYGNGFGFRQRLRSLGLEFFLQVTPQEHQGWTEEVPTRLQGKDRTVVEAENVPKARPLLEIARALPAEAWKPCAWKAASGKRQRTRLGLARGLPCARAQRTAGPLGEALVRGRLAPGRPGALPLLLGPLPSRAFQSPLLNAEPFALARRTLLPALQRRPGLRPLRGPLLARLSPPPALERHRLPVHPDDLPGFKKKVLD